MNENLKVSFYLKRERKNEKKVGDVNGIMYSVLDDKGNKVGRPFKSSLFGKEVGYEALQKHYEISKLVIEKKKVRDTLRPTIAEVMRKTKNKDDFKKLLKEQKLDVIFRQNEQGRIYGVTFIDYQNRTIMNGSRLGKAFSANVFNDLFNNPNKQVEESKRHIINDMLKQTEQTHQSSNSVSSLGSVLGLLNIPTSGNDYEEENFAREHERRKKKTKKRGRKL